MSRGSCGNVLAALASFFIPGLGQLLQGRLLLAAFMFVMTFLLWLVLLGWIIHLWSIIDAALYERPSRWRVIPSAEITRSTPFIAPRRVEGLVASPSKSSVAISPEARAASELRTSARTVQPMDMYCFTIWQPR